MVVQWLKNLPCKAEDMGSIPGLGIKIPCAVEQWTPGNATPGGHEAWLASPGAAARVLTWKIPSPAVKTWHSLINKQIEIFFKNKKGKTKSAGP